jgi:hypothetical protein
MSGVYLKITLLFTIFSLSLLFIFLIITKLQFMSVNEQELENKEATSAPVAETKDQTTENKEAGAEETPVPHDHHHSALYAESVVHSVVAHVHPHHRDLDL